MQGSEQPGGRTGAALDDVKSIVNEGLTAVKNAIDSAINNAEVKEPQLTQDALDVANSFLESHTSGTTKMVLQAFLGIGESTAKPAIDKLSQAGLMIARTDVDSAVNHLEQAF